MIICIGKQSLLSSLTGVSLTHCLPITAGMGSGHLQYGNDIVFGGFCLK